MTGRDPLMTARALVLHDLEAYGLARAETVSALEESLAQRRWWLSQWAEGEPYIAGLVAQDVQDAVLDRDCRWPKCPSCSSGPEHALQIQPELGPDPHWVCEQSGRVVAALGGLVSPNGA